MNRLLIFILIFLPHWNVAASSVDTVNISELELFEAPGDLAMGISSQHMAFSSIENSPTEVALDRTLVKAPFGKFSAFNNIFIPGLSIERMGFRFKDSDQTPNDTELYTVKLPLLFIDKLDDQWTRIINVTPSIHSDLEASDSESFSLLGLMLWKYSAGGPHSWTFGAGANRLFGEYQPIPMFSYAYSTHANTHFVLGFPASKAEHRFNKNWSLFSKLAPEGGNWRYRNREGNNSNLSYKSWIATVGIRKNLSGKFWASFEVGETFARKLEINDGTFEEELDVSNSNLVLFSIGMHP
ncbi:MAG: DUF6268 family outer membrane beta-barrel protein [Bermanella sp.]